MHDVGIFMMKIKEIHLVREFMAIEAAFFDRYHMKAVGITVHSAGAYAAAGGLAANDQGIDSQACEMRDQRRAEKAASPFFIDDQITGFGLEFLFDLEILPA